MSLTALLTMTGWTSVEGAVKRTAPAPSGIVTGVTGSPSAVAQGARSQPLSLGERLPEEPELITQQDETLEILWGQRTLIQVYPQTSLKIREQRDGHVRLQLHAGSVRVALAYGGPATDIVSVHTPTGRVFTRGGIVEVEVLSPPPSWLARMSTALSGTDKPAPAARIETVKVLEGQSGIEPLAAPGRSEMLEAGLSARVVSGVIQQVSNLPATADRGLGLAPTDRRQSTPPQLAQRIARVHVDHALEVERQVSTPTSTLEEKDVVLGADLKGTVVATSLGVPAVSLGAPSGAAAMPPGPTTAPSVPSFSPPVPTTPPGGSHQSGGFNSKSILKDVLKDALSDDRGRGRGRRGRDD